MIGSLFPARIWLQARRAPAILLVTLLAALITLLFINATIPLPFSLSQTSVPLVAYSPVAAVLLASWQMSLWLEPYESLSTRPIRRFDALLLLGLTLVFGIPLLALRLTGGSELALIGIRNFALGVWVAATLNLLLGVKRGCLLSVVGLLLIVPLTPRGPRGDSSWWALTEAPHNSLPTLLVVCGVVLLGVAAILFSGSHSLE